MENELLRKVQLTQLEMMKVIHNICIDNGITYYLCGGTTLGAIRHKGFIPWDDDLDIVLPRKDYDKLMEVLEIQLPPAYWLQNYSTDPSYWQPFAKIRKKGTVYKEVGMESIDDEKCGVWIDIFPLDIVKKPNSLRLKLRKFMVQTIGFSLRKRIFGLKYSAFSRRYIPAICMWGCIPLDKLKKFQVKLMKGKCCDKFSYFASLSSSYNIRKETYPCSWFDSGVSVPFEDTQFMIPKNYDSYLTQLFGDYMQLPPVEKRKGHNISDKTNVIV